MYIRNKCLATKNRFIIFSNTHRREVHSQDIFATLEMILKYKELNELQKEKTVYTAGSFDLFHSGHVNYLKIIKKRFPGYKLVVGVLSDKRIKSKKGKMRPIIKQINRIAVVDSIKYVDYSFIVPISEKDMTFQIIKKIRPQYVVFPQKKYKKIKEEFKKFGSRLIIQGRKPDKNSTTRIIERIIKKSKA